MAALQSKFDWDKEDDIRSFELAVCASQGELFEVCQDDYGVDAFDFAEKFMLSDIAASMDKPTSSYHSAGVKPLGDCFVNSVQIKPLTERKSGDALRWIGYMYRYWAWLGTPSSEIIKVAPVEKAYVCFNGYHTLAVQEAIRLFIAGND